MPRAGAAVGVLRHQVVIDLKNWIEKKDRRKQFNDAIRNAQSHELYDFQELSCWKDYTGFLKWLDALLEWVPDQDGDTRHVYEKIVKFYFILDQDPVRKLQSPVKPGTARRRLTWLSRWMVDFANAWGTYMDTPESAGCVRTFKDDPVFTWDEYMPPPSNYPPSEDYKAYRTFNQFFARHVKPGIRPIAGLRGNSVLVSPADSTFAGWWQIAEDSTIYFQFGGSDWVMVFERASNVQLICQPGVHYNQGTWIGNAYPYSMT